MSTEELKLLLNYQKYELINFIKEFFEAPESISQERKWLKSSDVCEQLSCSPSTLCRMRTDGVLQYSLVQGTYYYQQSDVDQMMDKGRGK
jgi:hypothetical protein